MFFYEKVTAAPVLAGMDHTVRSLSFWINSPCCLFCSSCRKHEGKRVLIWSTSASFLTVTALPSVISRSPSPSFTTRVSQFKADSTPCPAALHLLTALSQEPAGIFTLRALAPSDSPLGCLSPVWLTAHHLLPSHRFSEPRKAALSQKWHTLHFLHWPSGPQTCFLSCCSYPSTLCSCLAENVTTMPHKVRAKKQKQAGSWPIKSLLWRPSKMVIYFILYCFRLKPLHWAGRRGKDSSSVSGCSCVSLFTG